MDQFASIAIRSVPLWLDGLVLVVISFAACEVTQMSARAHGRSRETANGSLGFIVTPIFALLAFMLATTFSMGLQRFDDRRLALMNEVEAIGTEYDRASMLDQPYASAIQAQLRAFAHCRIIPARSRALDILARTRECRLIEDRMWGETARSLQAVKQTALGSYVVTGMNDVLSAATRRDVLLRSFIPTTVLTVLVLCILAASACLGLVVAGTKKAFRAGILLLLSLYAVCFILILDIDGSVNGSITISQLPMQELAARLDERAIKVPAERAPPG